VVMPSTLKPPLVSAVPSGSRDVGKAVSGPGRFLGTTVSATGTTSNDADPARAFYAVEAAQGIVSMEPGAITKYRDAALAMLDAYLKYPMSVTAMVKWVAKRCPSLSTEVAWAVAVVLDSVYVDMTESACDVSSDQEAATEATGTNTLGHFGRIRSVTSRSSSHGAPCLAGTEDRLFSSALRDHRRGCRRHRNCSSYRS